jgi:hypothetical protein
VKEKTNRRTEKPEKRKKLKAENEYEVWLSV